MPDQQQERVRTAEQERRMARRRTLCVRLGDGIVAGWHRPLRRGMLLGLLCALLTASQAQALPLDRVEREHLRMASSYFQQRAQCAPFKQRVASQWNVEAVAGPGVIGYAYQCQIVLSIELRQYSYRHGCLVMLHEYGHILGLDHARDPKNIMHAKIPWKLRIPQCEDRMERLIRGCERKRTMRAEHNCKVRWRL